MFEPEELGQRKDELALALREARKAAGLTGERLAARCGMTLARLANTEFQNVRASLQRGLHQKQRELAAFEADSQHVRFFLPLMITGLLQIPEYARASLANFPGDHPQAIAKRLDRQAALYNPAKRFTFVLTESRGALAALRAQGHGRADGAPGFPLRATQHPPRRYPAR